MAALSFDVQNSMQPYYQYQLIIVVYNETKGERLNGMIGLSPNTRTFCIIRLV